MSTPKPTIVTSTDRRQPLMRVEQPQGLAAVTLLQKIVKAHEDGTIFIEGFLPEARTIIGEKPDLLTQAAPFLLTFVRQVAAQMTHESLAAEARGLLILATVQPPTVAELAQAFTDEMKATLKPEQLAALTEASKTDFRRSTCSSHDHCDANMVMEAALRTLTGMTEEEACDAITGPFLGLVNEAWTAAKGLWAAGGLLQ